MASRSKAVSWRYIAQSVAVPIALWGTLASIPTFGQAPPPRTTLDLTVVRTPSELVAAADGGQLDLITYGSTASYSMRLTNTGPTRATTVMLSGTAPTGPTVNPDGGLTTTITAVTPAACRIAAGGATFSCNLGDIVDGQLADGGFLAAASVSGAITITLAAPSRPFSRNCTLADGGELEGTTLGNFTVTAVAANADQVTRNYQNTTQTRALADLAVTISGTDGARAGDTATYQVHGVNNGPCTANRPRLTNTAPSLLIFQSNSAGACQSGYPCTVASSWPVGASIDVTSTYTVDKLPPTVDSTGAVSNQVDLNSSSTPNPDGGAPLLFATPDPTTSNNTAVQQTWINQSTGCNSATGSTLGLFGIAVIILTVLRHRRRNT